MSDAVESRVSLTRRKMIQAAFAMGAGALLGGCSGVEPNGSLPEGGEAILSESPNAQTYWLYNPAGEKENGQLVDMELKQTMEREGVTKPSRAAEFTARVESVYTENLYGDVNELFYHRGWADGLPIVPPIEQNVSAMVKGTDLSRDHVVATLAPLGGKATVEKIAVNAVMAGCRPEHMPIVLAAVEAISDSSYDLVGSSTTTGPCVPMVIVNGPIAEQAGVNGGANALGRGWRANATIGRALQLIQQNIGGAWPRVSDYSTLGMPGDYGVCLAENEKENPWEPLQVELGYSQDQSAVTVACIDSVCQIVDIGVGVEGFLSRVANCIAGGFHVRCDYVLVLTPATALALHEEGWDKERIRSYINDSTLVHISRFDEGQFTDRGSKRATDPVIYGQPDENGMVKVPFVEHLTVIVAGGVGEKNEVFPLWGIPVTKEVSLPKNWDDLVAES